MKTRSGIFCSILLSFLFAALAAPSVAVAASDPMEALKYLPVQEAGRIKPFDSFARETLQFVYGAQQYTTLNGDKRPALEIVMTWMLVPEHWEKQKIMQILHKGLKDSLQFDPNEKYFSPEEILSNPRLPLVFQELGAKMQTKEKLDPYYQAAQRLEGQIGLFHAIRQGRGMHVAPPVSGDKWLTVIELDGALKEKFAQLSSAFVRALPNRGNNSESVKIDEAEQSGVRLTEAVSEFMALAKAQQPKAYGDPRDLEIEVHMNHTQPFLWAWILYASAAIVMAVAWQTGKKQIYFASWALVILAFFTHTYGFVLRMYLTGRPPVSNMYESVVWVSWGSVVFGMIFEILRRQKYVLLAGSVVATICLIVANSAPTILDSSLQPLEPVLRSNMWLTIHVLTIAISYSAYFLAMILGDIGLFFILRGEKPTGEVAREVTFAIYRAIQVGVVLLGAGIILGGVWADYSWGRFWGWDPKETWALIALLGYLAILHGRLAGWLQNFGLMMGAVVGFSLVLMAWYGVNFVLGAGLHSYGFGAGGIQYVLSFVLLHVLYVGYVAYVHRARKLAAAAPSKV